MPEPRKVDLGDPTSLQESMDRWKARVAKEQGIVSRHTKALQRARATVARRAKQIKALASVSFGDKVVASALRYVGASESPANSNKGPHITVWQEHFGLKGGGYPWCGAFAGAMVEKAGGDVTNRVVYTPYIVQDAKAGRNGFALWIDVKQAGAAKPGDLVLFNWPGGSFVDHVGVLRKPYAGKGLVDTVEGNTSPGNAGSQDNGGGVYLRSRPLSVVVGFARPKGA